MTNHLINDLEQRVLDHYQERSPESRNALRRARAALQEVLVPQDAWAVDEQSQYYYETEEEAAEYTAHPVHLRRYASPWKEVK